MKLEGHRVLVTGGSAGIGLELARRFLARGARVAICGRDAERLEAARRELGEVETIVSDLADPASPQALAAEAGARLGGLSILVNNAGVQKRYALPTSSPEQIAADAAWEIQVNLTSLVALTGACMPLLKTAPEAAIVNVSSGLAITPKASSAVYCATKAAVHSFSQALRDQCEDEAPTIRVFEILPPLVETAMTEGRGGGKISAAACAEESIAGIERDRHEIRVGKTKLLALIHRLAPRVAAGILRDG
ncbi:MAG: SDR family NAD(P)-dependent oxidoreductase [Pseudomonadales bacterium]|jgi:uncharacterized oxidoreductase|nr:SDR family NAD(P)-dependent oxidoreductase [Pseudomonadales bacterium]